VARRAALRALCSSSGIRSPARDVRAGFVDAKPRRCDIVVLAVLVVRDFGNAVVDQLAHDLLDRSEIAGCEPKRGMNGYKSLRETRF